MNGTDALISLIRTLEKAEVPYMIVGSYSSNFYGIPRSTKDADLVVSLDHADWGKLISILPTNLELEQQSSFKMVTSTRKELIKVKDSPFEIELFHLSNDDHDSTRFDRRQQVEIMPGVAACLPTAEDVIIQKLRWCCGAKRAKDFADVVAVLQVQGPERLDWPLHRGLVRQTPNARPPRRSKNRGSSRLGRRMSVILHSSKSRFVRIFVR